MNYLNSYNKAVNDSNLKRLEKLFVKQGLCEEYKIESFEIYQDEEGLPVLLIYADYKEMSLRGGGPGVKMLAVAADFSGQLKESLPDFKCLPCLLKAVKIPDEVKEILDPEVFMKYELLHIKKMTELYQEKPDLQKIRFNFDFSGIKEEKEMRNYVSMALEEFFHLEPEALEYNYENGQKMVYDFYVGRIIWFPAESKQEYIQSMLAGYLYEIECCYMRAAENAGITENLFREEFDAWGKSVFGPDAYKKYAQIRLSADEKLIDYSMDHNPGVVDYLCGCDDGEFCLEEI